MRILIVEDDRKLARQLQQGLAEQNHSATLSFSGLEGLELARPSDFDVIVLDVMLPGLDGLSIVRRLRTAGKTTPILLLTARDSNEDVVKGLDAGADDYLSKPFSFKVLLARLRALARRRPVETPGEFHVGDLSLNSAAHTVKRAGAVLPLTPTEFQILEALMRNAGRVIARPRLIEAVWGEQHMVEPNTVDVFIRQLRAKVEPEGAPKLIHTIRGVGYVLREEAE